MSKLYFIITNRLPIKLAVKLDHTLGNKHWRERQAARIRIKIRHTIRRLNR